MPVLLGVDIEKVASHIVDSAIKVHSALGPGLLESVYQRCFVYELKQRGLGVETETPVPIRYKAVSIDAGYRADMKVDGSIIVENKTVDAILPIHRAQLLTYLKLSGCRVGFLINWKVTRIKDGIERMIWNHERV